MVGALSRFSVSATTSVCCSGTGKGGSQGKEPPIQRPPDSLRASTLSFARRDRNLDGDRPDYLAEV